MKEREAILMKKEYESPKMEMFEIDVKDDVLGNSDCTAFSTGGSECFDCFTNTNISGI